MQALVFTLGTVCGVELFVIGFLIRAVRVAEGDCDRVRKELREERKAEVVRLQGVKFQRNEATAGATRLRERIDTLELHAHQIELRAKEMQANDSKPAERANTKGASDV